MKILVLLKRVADPDNANKIKVASNGATVDTSGLEWKMNPFDEYALESALRLTENAKAPKSRLGEVVVLTLAPKDAETTLRAALATGADRAIRVDATDEQLDGGLVALAVQRVIETEKPDLVLMGKQAVDGDSNQVGQRLAALLDWPAATFAATIHEEAEQILLVGREVDGGVQTVRLRLPALVTVDLRVVMGGSVLSRHTDKGHRYSDGVRFAPLPAILAAKKKPLEVRSLAELVPNVALTSHLVRVERPPTRKAGVQVKGVEELVDKLANEAKVL